ncbi:MAG: group 1 truncated hemoglobin [Mariprofundaceae bacterium]|nr:group 1 truncated hemoglobin [Mariprofundaceae bacterium]
MHFDAFIPAFLIFIVLGVVMPIWLTASADASRDSRTLFEKLGGTGAVDAAVGIFYGHVLNDAYVKRFFEDVDMDRQATKQKAFLTLAFGGPNNYSGKDMRDGHRHLVENMGLNDSHFEHILVHLRTTLAQLGVDEGLIGEVIDVANSTRADVLNK